MFGKIINNWHVARGDILRKEVEDTILRLGNMGTEINLHACLTLADAYHYLLECNGSITNMSSHGQKLTAKILNQKARKRFHFNVGQGYGLFLLSAYVEAHALPGDDAAFVKNSIHSMIGAASKTKDDFAESKKEERLDHTFSNHELVSANDFEGFSATDTGKTAREAVRPLHILGKLYWSAAKTNTSSFIKKLLAGKVPLWFVFWFVHTLPIVIIKAGAATSYNHSAGPVGVIHIPYFIFSAYLVLKTAKTKKRDLDGLGKNAFFETVAVVIVWVQIFSAIGKLLFL